MTAAALSVGSRICECAGCGAVFGGVLPFEKHRSGPAENRACTPPGSVLKRDGTPYLYPDARGIWRRLQ